MYTVKVFDKEFRVVQEYSEVETFKFEQDMLALLFKNNSFGVFLPKTFTFEIINEEKI